MVVDPRLWYPAFEVRAADASFSSGDWVKLLDASPARLALVVSEPGAVDVVQIRFQNHPPAGSDSGLYMLGTVEHFTFASHGGLVQQAVWAKPSGMSGTISWVETLFFPRKVTRI